jgi:hypothetical protein
MYSLNPIPSKEAGDVKFGQDKSQLKLKED